MHNFQVQIFDIFNEFTTIFSFFTFFDKYIKSINVLLTSSAISSLLIRMFIHLFF